MDARDHLNNQVIEIIEELVNKQKKRQVRSRQQPENQTSQPSMENKVVSIRPDQDNRINTVNQSENTILKDETQSLKSLLAARHNLDSLKARLNKDPEKNKSELEKLNKVEVRLNSSILKTQKREITLAIDTLKREPRRFILKLADTKSKIELLKSKLENNPRLYKAHYEKLEKFEKLIDKKIDNTQTKTLRSAIKSIQKNPDKYRQEIDRYDEMEKTLKQGLNQMNQNNLQHDKAHAMSHNQEKSRNDLELSR